MWDERICSVFLLILEQERGYHRIGGWNRKLVQTWVRRINAPKNPLELTLAARATWYAQDTPDRLAYSGMCRGAIRR